jgi:hypothetical protein
VAEALRYVRERELEETVVLRPRWLPRDAYFDHLHEADVGLSLHGPTLEGRFAARTRVLDYLAAGLPVVCTAGDTMSGLVAAHELGTVVRALDVDGCARAIDGLASGRPTRAAGEDVLEPFRWRNVARPLVEFCVDANARRGPSAGRAVALTARQYPAFLSAVYRSGPRDLTRAALRRASSAVRTGLSAAPRPAVRRVDLRPGDPRLGRDDRALHRDPPRKRARPEVADGVADDQARVAQRAAPE